MTSFFRYLALSLLLVSGLAAAKPAPDAAPLEALASFVGGVWRAQLPKSTQSGPTSLELRFEWGQNHQIIRFDSTWQGGANRSAPYTSGCYCWNGAQKTFKIVYADSEGTLFEGPVWQTKDVFLNDLTATQADGTTYAVQVRLTRHGANRFTNDIFLHEKDGSWKKAVSVKYVRE